MGTKGLEGFFDRLFELLKLIEAKDIIDFDFKAIDIVHGEDYEFKSRRLTETLLDKLAELSSDNHTIDFNFKVIRVIWGNYEF